MEIYHSLRLDRIKFKVNFDEATQAQLDEFLSTLDLMTSFPDYVTNDDVVLVVQVLEDLSKTDGEIKVYVIGLLIIVMIKNILRLWDDSCFF